MNNANRTAARRIVSRLNLVLVLLGALRAAFAPLGAVAQDEQIGPTQVYFSQPMTQTWKEMAAADKPFGGADGPIPNAAQTLSTSFAGVSKDDQIAAVGSGALVPDTMGAVGPDHFMEVINGTVAIYTKVGVRLSLVSLNSFFTLVIGPVTYPRLGAFDPRVIYDRRSGRWIASALERGGAEGNEALLAVSATSDPTGAWNKYLIPIGEASSFSDYVTLGTDDNGVYVCALIFGPQFGVKIAAVPKAQVLVAGTATVSFFGPFTDMGDTIQPAHNLDPVAADGCAWFVASLPHIFVPPPRNLRSRRLTWNGTTPTMDANFQGVVTPDYQPPLEAPASGSPGLDVVDDRLLMAVIRNHSLWTCRNIGTDSTGGAGPATRTACEWIQLNVAGATPSLVQSGRVFDPAASNPRYYFAPSIMVSGQGHAVMGFAGVASTEYVGAYFTGRLNGDATGTMGTVELIKAGEAAFNAIDMYGRNRWGDYSYTSLDPDDDMSIWTIQEYARPQVFGGSRWGTWVAKLLAPPPATPVTCLPATVAGGQAHVTLTVTGARVSGSGFYDPGSGFPNRLTATVNGGGVTVNSVTFSNPTNITLDVAIAGNAAPGVRTLTVTNPDGQAVTSAAGLLTVTTAPDIDVQGNGVSISDGDTTPDTADGTDFGTTVVTGGTITRSFTLRNAGLENLTLGTVTFSGPDAADFTVTTPPAALVAPSNSTTFQITFDPTAKGFRSTTVSLVNNDPDENSFDFAIQGLGLGEGDVDRDFNPGASNTVVTIAVQPDGKLVVGGLFTNLNGVARNFLARLEANGAVDSGFNAGTGPNNWVYATALQPDGKLVIGGYFSQVNGTGRNRIARLNANGTLDTNFTPGTGANGPVFDTVLQPDGKILIAGQFSSVNGTSAIGLARLNANGTRDTNFNPGTGPNNWVYATALQPDGKILIGGAFSSVNGTNHNNLARLNADGTLDASFSPSAGSVVFSLAVQPDGKLVLGGAFTAVNGTTRNHLARLNANGTLDAGFNPPFDDNVYSVALQADGKLLIGGTFTQAVNTARLNVARLNADGTLDQDWNPGANADVLSVTLQADGGIVLGGQFSTVGGWPRNRLARVLNGPATSTLGVTNSTRVQWLRGGSAPETTRVSFDLSTDGGTVWTPLGAGTRITGGWERTGLSLPSSGVVRARAYPVGGNDNGSSGLIEELASFPQIALPPLITGITRPPDGTMQIAGTGLPLLPYVLEAATNLTPVVFWQPVQTNNADALGNLIFLDPSATNFTQRFYRGRGL